MATYEHIELTEDELNEAILQAKIRKDRKLEHEKLEQKANENRKRLTQTRFSYDQTKYYALYRASKIFTVNRFDVDQQNSVVFDLLCLYFAEDQNFISSAKNVGITNPSLQKGILLAGNFGVGKTWLMKLFSSNQRQSFKVYSAKVIADEFEQFGEDSVETFSRKFENAINDSSSFFQRYSGLCIDDLGTEDVKVHFGNKKNVIGDLIEKRYFNKNVGTMLHGTTNLTADQIKEFYGGRVISRMREIFNFIELPGEDRRK